LARHMVSPETGHSQGIMKCGAAKEPKSSSTPQSSGFLGLAVPTLEGCLRASKPPSAAPIAPIAPVYTTMITPTSARASPTAWGRRLVTSVPKATRPAMGAAIKRAMSMPMPTACWREAADLDPPKKPPTSGPRGPVRKCRIGGSSMSNARLNPTSAPLNIMQ
jgi:hypothetical protein